MSVKKRCMFVAWEKGIRGRQEGEKIICITNLTPYNDMLSVFYSLIGRFSVNIFITSLN